MLNTEEMHKSWSTRCVERKGIKQLVKVEWQRNMCSIG